MRLGHRRQVLAIKLERCFQKAPHLFRKLNDEARSEEFVATTGFLDATLVGVAVLLSANYREALPYIKATTAHIRGQVQSVTFISRTIYWYAATLLEALSRMHSPGCETHPVSFLLNKIWQALTFYC